MNKNMDVLLGPWGQTDRAERMERMRHLSAVRARTAICLMLGIAILMAVAASAQAAPKGVVGYFGNPPGVNNSSLAGQFGSVQGVAVNSNPASSYFGDVYVVDQSNERIQRFSSLGAFELMWGRDVINSTPAVDTDRGQVFERCTFAPDCKAGIRGTLGGEFFRPRGVAVDQATGNVYVVERNDAGGARVQSFTGDGEFLWALGKDVIANGSASDPTSITATQVCTVAADCKSAEVGVRGGEFGVGGSSSQIGGGNGVAVSPVVNPMTGAGNIVVTDRANRRVQEFAATGAFLGTFGWDTAIDGSSSDPASVTGFQICAVAADCKEGTAGAGAGQFGTDAPNRVAVDSTGAIYTVENSANFRLQKFTPQAGPPALSPAVVAPSIGATGLTGAGSSDSPLDVAVGPSDHVFVLRAFPAGTGTPAAPTSERRVVELDSAGSLVDTHAARAGITGTIDLAINSASEELYLTTASPPTGGGTGLYVLGAPPLPPGVSLSVEAVTADGARLDGLVDPGGPGTPIGISTRYRFEYRVVGAATWTAPSGDRDAGDGFDAVPVVEALEGLNADTEYEARLVAWRPFSGLDNSVTAPVPFTTPAAQPDIESVYVTDRGSTTATLNARINPNGSQTSYRFEYGPTVDYGTTVPVPDGDAGAGDDTQIVGVALAGLTPGAVYHYRVTAVNANGTNVSDDRTFTARPAAPTPTGRAYELVSPADKIGGTGLGSWYAGVGSHGNSGIGSYERDRYVSNAYYGGSLAEGGFSYGADWTLGERTLGGWVNRSAFNRPGGFGAGEFAKVPALASASDDFGLTAWTANSQLQIFAGQVAAWGDQLAVANGPALREWESGRWEIAAPLAPIQQVGAPANNANGAVISQMAADGGHALVAGHIRGVAGSGDPTSPPFVGGPSDLVCPNPLNPSGCNRNVYVDDVTGGLSDSFPGDGIRSLVNVCTGAGPERTAIPAVDVSGDIVAVPCPDALTDAGRDARLISPRGASLAVATGVPAPGHISDDGSRMFFMSPDHMNGDNNVACTGAGPVGTKCPPQVYVSQRNGDGSFTTRWISESQVEGQDASLMAAAVFEGATPDGDKAFFRTASPLTADDPNGGQPQPQGVTSGTPSSTSVDLYMYDFPDAPGADLGDGTLTRISAGPTGAGDANVSTDAVASPTSALRGFGADGSRLYFVTAAPLAGVPAPAGGTVTSPGGTRGQGATRNLYSYDAGRPVEERWRFVAQLPVSSTLGTCAAKGLTAGPGGTGLTAGYNGTGLTGTVRAESASGNCVRVTADGSFVTFFTDGRLTADDPDAVTGDVYAYDAALDELVRLSAAEDGADVSYECVTEPGAGMGTRCHGDPAITSVGDSGKPVLGLVTSGSRDRTAFFESASRLVAEDQNDVYDVYQWRDGELSLLSTGAPGAEPALYRGNDRAGANVYISTRDRLSWQDHDAVLDVYSARVDGGIPQPDPPVVCQLLADGCQGGGAVPVTPAPQTTAPSGQGNADHARKRLTVGRPSRKARRVAARSGVLKVAVRVSRPGRVTAVARARVGKRMRRVARKSIQVRRAGKATLRLRLNRVVRRRLSSGRATRIVVRVTSPGAHARAMTVRLPGAKS